MAEMKDAINALGEFQELKSQVSSTQDIQAFIIRLVFTSFYYC